jgi:hypothetical protein
MERVRRGVRGGERGARWAAWLGCAAVAAAAGGACSQAASHPPELGDCHGDDASCPGAVVAGGGSGNPAADAATSSSSGCSVNASDPQCVQCENADCCSMYDSCINDSNCRNLDMCEASGIPASTCNGMYPLGIGPLTALNDCIQVKCPVCAQFGVGDPCNPAASACNPGLTCEQSWCSKTCVRGSDCAGLGANGGNELNLPSACMLLTGLGQWCTPGCESDSDCVDFPSTYCAGATSFDGQAVQVCLPLPDAGTSD